MKTTPHIKRGQRRGRTRKRDPALLVAIIILLMAAAGALIAARYCVPMFRNGKDVGESASLSATLGTDELWTLEWSRFDDAGLYSIRLNRSDNNAVIWENERVSGETVTLDRIIPEGTYTLYIRGRSTANLIPLSFTEKIELINPSPSAVVVEYDREKKDAVLSWDPRADTYQLFDLTGGEEKTVKEFTSNSIFVTFGSADDFPMPTVTQDTVIGIAGKKADGRYTVYGNVRKATEVKRDCLFGEKFNLQATLTERNTAVLTWEETKGIRYAVSLTTENGNPRQIYTTLVDGDTTVESPVLPSGSSVEFRICALGLDDEELCEEICVVETGLTPVYCTVWTNKPLDIFSESRRDSDVVGRTGAAEMYCVLDEQEGMFQIRCEREEYGWIDSNYCMINLPEYIRNKVSYDITNSYNSQYTLHEYEIYGLSGTVVPGYETVRQEDGSFIVPLLYPTAKKLAAAADAALEQGFRLRLYDTYRPRSSTNYIYDRAAGQMNYAIPFRTWTGNEVGFPSVSYELGRSQMLMIDFVQGNGWELGSFLARGGSCHNQGIAIDLGIEDAVSGEYLPAQTMMHDLSIFSTTGSNNANAKMLFDIMQSCGLRTIASEWWHFQDNESLNTLNLAYTNDGVSIMGWHYDGTEWVYVNASGQPET